MSEMKANDYIAALGEQGYYIVKDWANEALPCTVVVWPEPADGRHVDPAEEVAHYANDPVAVGEGASYLAALEDAYRKVN